MRTHGTISCYHHGCRCDECTTTSAAYRTRARARAQGTNLDHPCWFCHRHFTSPYGARVHMDRIHEREAAA